MWAPAAPDWDADGEFIPGSDEEGGGRWQFARPVPREGWDLAWEEVRFRAQCTPFRHLAFFPDMAPQWAWMRERLGEGSEALNLFGYTGVGTLAMAAKGARLTHVDASKKSVEAAKANAALSGMADLPIRWLVDDAAKFAAREVRRGPPLRRHHPRSAQVRPRPRRRDLAARRGPARPDRRLPQIARRRQPLPRPHRLCGPDVGAGDRRIARARRSPISAAPSNAARWRCARKRAACCCRPRSSRAGPSRGQP